MPYWDIVGRSFRIAWRHKYLWLIALFSGEGGFSFNFSSSYRQPASGRLGSGSAPDFGAVQAQVGAWVQDNLGLLALLAVLWLVLVVGFFLLAAACEAAVVRAAAEHDAEQPFDLAGAWRTGVERMWVIVRFRLILVALALPVFVILTAVVIGAVAAGFNGQAGTVVALILLGLLVLLAAIPYAVYLSFLDRFGSRAAVLELTGARESLSHAHRLLFKRPGRALVVWLLSIAVTLGLGVAAGVVAAIALVPFVVVAYSAANGAISWAWVAVAALVALPVMLLIGSFIAAQASTYWTIAFRRMDVEYPPSFAYPAVPVPRP